MSFSNPAWLLMLVPLAALLARFRPRSNTLLALRAAALTLCVLALAGLSLRFERNDGVAVLVADRSLSMPKDHERRAGEIYKILSAAAPGKCRVGVVSFGAEAAAEKMPGDGVFDGFKADIDSGRSNLAAAMETALAMIPADSPGRILVVSDGEWTGRDPSDIFARCAARGVAVDCRVVRRPEANDLCVEEIQHPMRASSGEYYPLTAAVRAPAAMKASFRLLRGGKVSAAGETRLHPGVNHLTFRDKADTPQTVIYSFEIASQGGPEDPVPGNNKADFAVKIEGKRPLLLVSASHGSGAGKTLRAAGLDVTVKKPHEISFDPASLSGYCAVIIENVPASAIGTPGMGVIAEMVRNGLAGLALSGGQNSLGPGGYHKSPLDPVLPVSMEVRKEHRKLSLALVAALDRSGSMGAPAGGGKTKMDLANLASAESLELLGPGDQFGLIAVDSSPHEIVPLMPAEQAKAARRKILSIQSMGGGIFIYEALAAAAKVLAPAAAGTKHILLFADAADSEEPGKYRELLEKCSAAGITVSVIGLGSERDCDAPLLRDIAERGGGQCMFTANPAELPRLFAQDTFTVSKRAFREEETGAEICPAMSALSPRSFEKNFAVGGYNICLLKPEARAGAVCLDEFRSPLLAFWHAGAGRAAVYTGELDGPFTGPFAKWSGAGDFITAVAAWVSGLDVSELPGGMTVSQEISGGAHKITMRLDPDRGKDPFRKTPVINTLSGRPGRAPRTEPAVTARWSDPDTLTAEIPLSGSEISLSSIKIDDMPPFVLAPAVLPYSPEFRPADSGGGLERLCRAAGGAERADLSEFWKNMRGKKHERPAAPLCLFLALALLTAEVWERRTEALSKLRAALSAFFAKKTRARRRREPAPHPAAKVEPVTVKTATPKPDTPAPAAKPAERTQKSGLTEALDKAKKAASKTRPEA
jgi:Mg-chelatase subunit ChlD